MKSPDIRVAVPIAIALTSTFLVLSNREGRPSIQEAVSPNTPTAAGDGPVDAVLQKDLSDLEFRSRLGLPLIRSVEPTSAAPGSWVTIIGENFTSENTDPASMEVWLTAEEGSAGSIIARRIQPGFPPSFEPNRVDVRIPETTVPQRGKLAVITGGKGHRQTDTFEVIH